MTKQYTGIFKCIELDSDFLVKIESICQSITKAGLDPYSQLTGYLLTHEDAYITRTGNARALISTLEYAKVEAYVKSYLEK